VTDVDPEPNLELDRLVELRAGGLLDQVDRLGYACVRSILS